jgi:hypothetical protein
MKNHGVDADMELTTIALPTRDKRRLEDKRRGFQYLNFFCSFSIRKASTYLVSKFSPKGTPNSLASSLSFTHFHLNSFVHLGFYLTFLLLQ